MESRPPRAACGVAPDDIGLAILVDIPQRQQVHISRQPRFSTTAPSPACPAQPAGPAGRRRLSLRSDQGQNDLGPAALAARPAPPAPRDCWPARRSRSESLRRISTEPPHSVSTSAAVCAIVGRSSEQAKRSIMAGTIGTRTLIAGAQHVAGAHQGPGLAACRAATLTPSRAGQHSPGIAPPHRHRKARGCGWFSLDRRRPSSWQAERLADDQPALGMVGRSRVSLFQCVYSQPGGSSQLEPRIALLDAIPAAIAGSLGPGQPRLRALCATAASEPAAQASNARVAA